MSASISQMQMLYVPEEDRILFRVNSSDKKEFRFWVTRRYALLLLGVLDKHAQADLDVSAQVTPDAQEAVQNFKKEQAIQGANFEEKFADDAVDFPLGDKVLVAHTLNYKFQGQDLILGVKPKAGQGIDMTINAQVNPTLTQIILRAAAKAEWNMGDGYRSMKKENSKLIIN